MHNRKLTYIRNNWNRLLISQGLYLPLLLVTHIYKEMANKKINRIKSVLADKDKTSKWLAEQMGKDKTTISKWCTNSNQPDVESLIKISKLLGVEVNDLLVTD